MLLENGYTKGGTCVYNDGGQVTINGGTFKGNDYAYAITNNSNGTMKINNCNVTTGRGAVAINNGTVEITGGTFTAEGKNGSHGIYVAGGTLTIGGTAILTYTGTNQEIYKNDNATVNDNRNK